MASLEYKFSATDRMFVSDGTSNDITITPEDASTFTYIDGVAVSKGGLSLSSYTPIDSAADDPKLHHIHFDSSTAVELTIGGTAVSYNTGDLTAQSYDRCDSLLDNDTSYELLRVNPKLTGNIKVVVDSSSNLYLDTIKVSTGLSQVKYRHIPVNPDEYYGTSLMHIYKHMPTDDLYRIEDGCYEIFAPANNLGEQYYDKYNSGVRTSDDDMYSENFAMMAPLCVKKKIPDFFLIFKVKDYENIPTNADKIKYFIENGEIIKVFDMRDGSNIGKYIRNIYEHSKNFVGDIYTGYDYNTSNVFHGISLERGVVAKIYEDIASERKIKNQVAMNDWYTLGFQRNHIVSKDIVNLEFMFDDPDAETFALNTYFGIYVRLNGVSGGFSCIGQTNKSYTFDKEVNGSQGTDENPSFDPQENMDVIYGMSTPDTFHRLSQNIEDISEDSIVGDYKLRPYKCIVSPNIKHVDRERQKCFASMTLNDVMTPGEHYIITDTVNHIIYNVVISNYLSDKDISEIAYYKKGIDIDGGQIEYEIRTVSIYNVKYRSEVPDKIKTNTISLHCGLLTKAFNKFGGKIAAYTNDTDTLSVIYDAIVISPDKPFRNQIIIEKVMAECGFTSEDSLRIAASGNDGTTSFFGIDDLESFLAVEENWDDIKLLYPHGMDHFGNRRVIAVNMLPIWAPDNRMYNIDSNIIEQIKGYDTVIYESLENGYQVFNYPNASEDDKIAIYYYTKEGDTIKHTALSVRGYGSGNNYIVKLKQEAKFIDDKLRLYQNYPINCGPCSIFPLRDFNFNVIDTVSQFTINSLEPDAVISDTPGEYQSTDNVFGKAIASGTEESICDYMDKYERFVPDNHYVTSGTMTDYLSSLSSGNHKSSDISLISPYCCKWRMLGTDMRGESMRVMYPFMDAPGVSSLTDSSSYFIAGDSDSYIGYTTSSNDAISSADPKTLSKCVGDALVRDNHLNYRDYLMNGDGMLNDVMFTDKLTKNKWSKAYSYGNDSIEFISSGLKLRISTKNKSIVDFSKYNGYSAAILCMSGSNPTYNTPCEIFIDEIKEQLVFIIYSGIDSENIGYSEETRIPGAVQVAHHSPISDCKVTYIGGYKRFGIPDDAKFYNDTSLFDTNGTGYVILSSPQKDFESYTEDKYVHVSATIDGSVYDDSEKDFLMANGNAHITIDSSVCNVSNFTINNLCTKYRNNVDEFIFTFDDVDTTARTAAKPYRLSDIKDSLSNTSVYVKTVHGTMDYTGIENLVEVKAIDPYDVTRENSDYKPVTYGKVYNSFAEPVTHDIFEFSYMDSSLNETFGKSFDGCNIRISDVHDIDQTWMRKVIYPDSVLKSADSSSWTSYTTKTDIKLALTDLALEDMKKIPEIGTIYQQAVGDVSTNFTLIATLMDRYNTYKVDINDNSKLDHKPVKGEYWSNTVSSVNNGMFIVYDASVTADASSFWHGSVTFAATSASQNPISDDVASLMTHDLRCFAFKSVTSTIKVNYPTLIPAPSIGDRYQYTNGTLNRGATLEIVSMDPSTSTMTVKNMTQSGSSITIRRDFPDNGTLTKVSGRGIANISYTNRSNVAAIMVPGEEYTVTEGSNTYSFDVNDMSTDTSTGDMTINMIPAGDYADDAITESGTLVCSTKSVDYDSYTVVSIPSQSSMVVGSVTPMFDLYKNGFAMLRPTSDTYYITPTNSSLSSIEDPNISSSLEYTLATINTDTDSSTIVFDSMSMTSSISLIHGISPMKNCWYTNMYRMYNNFDEYVYGSGIESGYEKNLFLASRGLMLKHMTDDGLSLSIEHSDWKYYNVDNENFEVVIDITSEIVNKIFLSDGYTSNWKHLTSVTDKHKINYINNSIMRYIKINNETKIEIYRMTGSSEFDFVAMNSENADSFELMKNIPVEMYYENNKYYLRISDLKKHTYSAKITLNP